MKKTKAIVAVVLVAALALAIGFFISRNASPSSPSESPGAEESVTGPSMALQIIDDHGKPLSAVSIRVGNTVDDRFSLLTTNGSGQCKIPTPSADVVDLLVLLTKPGYVPAHRWWQTDDLHAGLPATFTFAMSKATRVGGIVVDDTGKPVVEASVTFDLWIEARGNQVLAAFDAGQVVTDHDGRWVFATAPAKFPRGPLIVIDAFNGLVCDLTTARPDKSILLSMNAKTVMRPAGTLRGIVSDEHGKPIARAHVTVGDDHLLPNAYDVDGRTDATGRFAIPNMAVAQRLTLTVRARGHGPALTHTTLDTPGPGGTTPLAIQLDTGRVVHGTVSDSAGKPLGGAWIEATHWFPPDDPTGKFHTLELFTITDADGTFRLADAPTSPFDVSVSAAGRTGVAFKFDAGTLEGKITLPPLTN